MRPRSNIALFGCLSSSVFSFFLQAIYEVMNSTNKTCHCHGISGSCTFSVCHSILPEFSSLAVRIKKMYGESCKVALDGGSRSKLESVCGRPHTESDLIHKDENNWCEVNPEVGSVGVSGRECSAYADAPNSCAKICGACGRGSKEHSYEEVTQCDCSFHFCCEIHCKTCTEKKTSFKCS